MTFAADPPALGAAREGAPLVAGLAGAGIVVARRYRLAGLALLALAGWCAWFFRDPRRRCPAEPGVLYAPADGTVTAVDEVPWDWFIHGRALRIVTFLSVLDVHVNRSPAAGRLVAYRRDPGGFAPAFLLGHSEQNARQLLGIEVGEEPGAGVPAAGTPLTASQTSEPSGLNGPSESERQRIVVAQIVGIMARRILSWRLPGDALFAGQKLGMIRFGSRTDLLVPAGLATPLVQPGAVVRAGITPVARYLGPAA